MVLRQEIEGPRSKQLEFVFCGLIPQDKNSKNAEGRRLGPAHIEDERPHISHSLSQETSLTTHVQKGSLEVRRGVMLIRVHYP